MSAAEDYRKSEAAHRAETERSQRERRTEQIRELDELAYQHAGQWPSELAALSESVQPDFQLTLGKSSHPSLGHFIDQLRSQTPELCPPTPDEFTSSVGCTIHAGIQPILGQDLPQAYINGFIISSDDDVWFLTIPFLVTSYRGVQLIPSLSERLGQLTGPRRLGLASSRRAADELGASCIERFPLLVEAFLRAAATGENVMNFDTWGKL
jgi:hypothetical protein